MIQYDLYTYRGLPHSVRKPDDEVCLFVKDLERKSREFEVSEDHFKELLASKGVTCISQVLSVLFKQNHYNKYTVLIKINKYSE